MLSTRQALCLAVLAALLPAAQADECADDDGLVVTVVETLTATVEIPATYESTVASINTCATFVPLLSVLVAIDPALVVTCDTDIFELAASFGEDVATLCPTITEHHTGGTTIADVCCATCSVYGFSAGTGGMVEDYCPLTSTTSTDTDTDTDTDGTDDDGTTTTTDDDDDDDDDETGFGITSQHECYAEYLTFYGQYVAILSGGTADCATQQEFADAVIAWNVCSFDDFDVSDVLTSFCAGTDDGAPEVLETTCFCGVGYTYDGISVGTTDGAGTTTAATAATDTTDGAGTTTAAAATDDDASRSDGSDAIMATHIFAAALLVAALLF